MGRKLSIKAPSSIPSTGVGITGKKQKMEKRHMGVYFLRGAPSCQRVSLRKAGLARRSSPGEGPRSPPAAPCSRLSTGYGEGKVRGRELSGQGAPDAAAARWLPTAWGYGWELPWVPGQAPRLPCGLHSGPPAHQDHDPTQGPAKLPGAPADSIPVLSPLPGTTQWYPV